MAVGTVTKIPSAQDDRMSRLKILTSLMQSPAHAALRNEDFFSHDMLIHSPLLLPDMEKAVGILERRLGPCLVSGRTKGDVPADARTGELAAGGDRVLESHGSVDETEDVLIAGDRDVDGVTSTVLLTDFLRRSTPCGVSYVNSSEGDDYGLTGSFFERMHDSRAGLVILLDMGSAHLEQALRLVDAGKDVIILDHHIPQIPPAVASQLHRLAFVNPRMHPRAAEMGHQGKIATAGLAFKLILAMRMRNTDLWDRLLRIDIDGDQSVLYRAGALIAAGPTVSINAAIDEQVARCEREGRAPGRVHRMGMDGLGRLCRVFEERPADEWRRLLASSPVEFGRYLFACSILHRPDLLQCVVQECDLASIGLVADLVPLVSENRRMVALGLGRERRRLSREGGFGIEFMVRPGLLALFRETGLDPLDMRTRDINFSVNPLINAAGRMGQTEKALELLLCRDSVKARSLAADLQRLNGIRRERTEQNHRIVSANLELDASAPLVFFYHPELQPGISGLMATRLLETTGRPAVWVNPDGAHARGSARGRAGWNMVELLQPLSPFLVQLGGHAEACGFTIAYDRIDEFRAALFLRAREYEAGRVETADTDASPHRVLLSHRQLGPGLMDELNLLEPFGAENPEPEICLDRVQIVRAAVMKKGVHLRFSVQGCMSDVEFVYWNCPSDLREAVLQSQEGEEGRSPRGGESTVLPLWRLTGFFEKNRIPRMKPLRFRVTGIKPGEAEPTLTAEEAATGRM